MKTWNSSPHPISDIRDWKRNNRLEIRPDFQRHEVWSLAAKIMLMDTILKAIPMPKVFVSSTIRDDQVYRTVIDGQQRISSIIAFMADQFSLAHPYVGKHQGLTFSELPDDTRSNFLQYRIDFNEAIGFSDEELRETYSRLNKYSVALTKQELRRADYPGAFLELAERLALHDFLDTGKIFSVANRRRLADVEFISELLAGLIAGPQEKKETLDDFYLKYSEKGNSDLKNAEKKFLDCLSDMALLFPHDRPLSATRFKQKSDFYSLVLAIDELKAAGGSLDEVPLSEVQMDIRILDFLIEPESASLDCRDYAIKCVSQANTIGSRKWRKEFLKAILTGSYMRSPPSGDAGVLFYRLATGNHGPFGAPNVNICGKCKEDVSHDEVIVIGWKKNSPVFQVNNSQYFHVKCAGDNHWHYINFNGKNDSLTFTYNEVQLGLI